MLIGPEFMPVSIALNGQVTIACYPEDRTLVYRKALSTRSLETQLPICCWVDGGGGGTRKELWLYWGSNSSRSHESADALLTELTGSSVCSTLPARYIFKTLQNKQKQNKEDKKTTTPKQTAFPHHAYPWSSRLFMTTQKSIPSTPFLYTMQDAGVMDPKQLARVVALCL